MSSMHAQALTRNQQRVIGVIESTPFCTIRDIVLGTDLDAAAVWEAVFDLRSLGRVTATRDRPGEAWVLQRDESDDLPIVLD